ncbi:DNA ligase 1-like [Mercenaria mercenaria]|uniref:DNA ligase 1-like n=1 Tax=Mercenaria mercenaria TaxID=6596 RepID=UPI00234F826E|nr:DNA ligase 1-like [Mercenaria mercenaria]
MYNIMYCFSGGTTEATNIKTRETCGSFTVNPLVEQGLIPQSMAQILIPPPKQPSNTKIKRSKVITEGRVISGDEMLRQLKEKEKLIKRQIEAKEERLQLKEKRKQEKEKESEGKKAEERRRKKVKRTKKKRRKYKESSWWPFGSKEIHLWSEEV